MKNATRLTFSLLLTCGAFLARPCAAAPGEWDYTNSLAGGRYYHTATPLADGKVLVAAGSGFNTWIATCEIYDPTVGQWSPTGSLAEGRYFHTATTLANGRIMVAGGVGAPNFFDIKTVEIYDPATGIWSATGSMINSRSKHVTVLLPNGMVLAAGGSGTFSTDLYNPATGVWSFTGSMHELRDGATRDAAGQRQGVGRGGLA